MITPIGAPCLLVATPSMLDGNFQQTVLLLVEYNAEGAIGFVLNRPSTCSLKSMISLVDRDVPEAIPAWFGGPVDTTTGIVLHDRKPADGDVEVAPAIYLSSAGRVLDALIDYSARSLDQRQIQDPSLDYDAKHPYRFLVGYAGWGAGQLDDELRSGAWLLCPLDRKLVFDMSWADLWSKAMEQVGVQKNAHMPTQSQNAYLN